MKKSYFGSETFCAMPFVNLTTAADGAYRFCCIQRGTIKDKEDKQVFLDKKSPKQVWNEETFKDVRQKLINGEQHEGCSHCYYQEKVGERSFRQNMTDEWIAKLGRPQVRKLVQEAIDNDYNLFSNPVYLDLKLGTLCNLKCRMCNPYNSSQIEKEQFELWDKDEDYQEAIKFDYNNKAPEIAKRSEWFEADLFWSDIISYIPDLKKVYFTGGEPTMIKGNTEFLSYALEAGRKDLRLFFNTNCTNINKRFFSYISQFDQVDINGSLDGYGSMNDYIRYPAKWSAVSAVFEKYAQLPNINLGATPVLQTYNIFNLGEVVKYVEEVKYKYDREVFIDVLLNTHPSILDVNILPYEIRKQARDRLWDIWDSIDQTHIHGLTKSGIRTALNILGKEGEPDSKKIEVFLKYTKSLDNHRKQKFSDYCPELSSYLEKNYVKSQL